MDTTIQAQIPERLVRDAQALVDHGWAASIDSLLAEALRRYLESHREALAEQFIREDAEWGLHGEE